MKYYKVVYVANSEIVSVFAPKPFEVSYQIGEVTTTPEGTIGLFAYKISKEIRKKYNTGKGTPYQILVGTGEPMEQQVQMACNNSDYFKDWYQYHKLHGDQHWVGTDIQREFPGTILLKWFKPERMLKG